MNTKKFFLITLCFASASTQFTKPKSVADASKSATGSMPGGTAGKMTPKYDLTKGSSFSIAGSGGPVDSTTPSTSTPSTTSAPMMTGNNPAVYSSAAPTSGMTAANQIVTASAPSTTPMVGADPNTWAPSQVIDSSGNFIGNTWIQMSGPLAVGTYSDKNSTYTQDAATFFKAQQAIFIDTTSLDPASFMDLSKVTQVGTVAKNDKTIQVYKINASAPTPAGSPSDTTATVPTSAPVNQTPTSSDATGSTSDATGDSATTSSSDTTSTDDSDDSDDSLFADDNLDFSNEDSGDDSDFTSDTSSAPANQTSM